MLVASSIFLASYWSARFGTFHQAPALASYWLTDFAGGTPTIEKLTDKTQLTLSEAPTTIQSPFIMD
jgi:hypothetical protein